MTLQHFTWIRSNTLKLGESIDDAVLKVVPNGFNNNILWNLGHLYGATEGLLFRASGRDIQLPEAYVEAFGGGTSPKTWTNEPPSREDILSRLAEQSKRVAETFEGHLDEALPKELNIAGIEMKTVADLLDFTTLHESMHFTTSRLYNTLLKSSS